jgi:hypothetical protein
MATWGKKAYEHSRWAEEQQRRDFLEHARDLARSGQYPGSDHILAELKRIAGFEVARSRLNEPEVRQQLDRLCDVARTKVTRIMARG